MKIFVTGTRGIPGIQGGVETHCQELYPRLVKMGHEVVIARRKAYVDDHCQSNTYKGVRLVDVPTVKSNAIEAFVHTFLAVLKARTMNPDLVHIHAIGPSIMAPLARLLGLKVVVTNHGPDYDRQKWGRFAKRVLKTGENLGTRYSNQVIAISEPIRTTLKEDYKRQDVHLVFNGVNTPIKHPRTDYLESLGIQPGNYLFAAGRFVPEKGFIDLIKAWDQLPEPKPQLVIAGDSDHETCYSKGIKKHAKKYGAILTGFVKGGKLNQLFSHARLFVMPSYHEGLPIALLEALSYGLDVVVSNIPANLEVALDPACFFETGNRQALTASIQKRLTLNQQPDYEQLLKKYNWDTIALQTEAVYKRCMKNPLSKAIKPDPVRVTH
ncbi:glycosyltransferase family 4 protein [Mangrovibacterium diazotrophicum]|uniref:Glycosyltransferase involved in cell wall biosynthesis n=1 Tax=Mangrovibacterium diazotrophicum TaxID=1261403 RepID=A0A419W934_9BACT|nr:glycosyltransferase family 4 protein [Mangrovibacterium diazotrophicum]RKD91988.1 glycosyltransferase involved in cell wall biosynthesis [Mangrovibacterium diazotrophicum]